MENVQFIEVWRDIAGYEGLYQVSSLGKIKSIKNNVVLKPQHTGYKLRYVKVNLWKLKKLKQFNVHSLVAKAFPEICGEWFEGCEVDHLNTICDDNRAINLKVCTIKENHNNPLTRIHLSDSAKSYPHKKGIVFTEERKRNIGKALKGKFPNEKNPNAKSIDVFDSNGNYIRTYDCVKNMVTDLGFKYQSVISHIWKYKDSKPYKGYTLRYT